MKILLTGATGYIGTRLLPHLIEQGHTVYPLARELKTLRISDTLIKNPNIVPIQGDLLNFETLTSIPKGIDCAYYLVHSMSHRPEDFQRIDLKAVRNFIALIERTTCRQIIYLTGIVNDANLSKHLRSRLEIETCLKASTVPVTVLRAAIIIGSGSASFEIMRDLIEKLPIMIAPKWLQTRCQPIGIADVLFYLVNVVDHPSCVGKTFDIGGPDILTYKEMLLGLAKVRKLKRRIFTVPFFSLKLSSYWLFFVTSTNHALASTLVQSMKNDVICSNNQIGNIFSHMCLDYSSMIEKAFVKLDNQEVLSSWRDASSASGFDPRLLEIGDTPRFGCYKMSFVRFIGTINPDVVFSNILKIGGHNGWYYMNWAWKIRGLIDRLLGGIGLRRGRTSKKNPKPGDVIDFWRILKADKVTRHLILYAEMKIPGEAWLELRVKHRKHTPLHYIKQTATFRPKGVWGRLYWYLFYPIHLFLFPGMLKKITTQSMPEALEKEG
jgi:uncharacterized protein YbjT (DUF2867 family)